MQRTLFNWCILPLFRMLFFTDIPSFAVLKLFSLLVLCFIFPGL